MLQSFFNGLSGLFSFSRGLNTVSNNISNMNTAGFRGSDTFFRSINGSGNQSGFGTSASDSFMRTNSGEIRNTGIDNSTGRIDLALNGSGFFTVRDDDGNLFYTRSGNFQFNEDGILVDILSGFEVMSLDANGNLSNVNISEQRMLAAEPTTLVNLVGALGTGDSTHTIEGIKVYDAGGIVHTLSLEMQRPAGAADNLIWNVEIKDENGATVGTGTIRFSPDSTPLAGFNTVNASLNINGVTQAISFNFGEPGSFTGTSQTQGTQSTASANVDDGRPVIGLKGFTFDENGQLQLTYSNGEKEEGVRLAIASFVQEGNLTQATGSLYRTNSQNPPTYGYAAEGVNGKIQSGSLELSNVDLTQEFADMMIIQRGYQASSRIMSVSNEMVEQLYNNTRGG